MVGMLSPAQCVEIARKTVTASDWAAIVEAAVREAKAGDKAARDFLCRFCLPEKIDENVGEELARILIFREATQADFDLAKKADASAKDG